MNKATTIDAYIESFPGNIQRLLQQVRAAIKRVAPEAEEKMSYGIPTFTFNGNLVHFGAFKNHIGFYPTSSGVEAFQNELSSYHTSKGAIQFPIDEAMPLDLIKEIVSFRLEKNKEKKKPIKSK